MTSENENGDYIETSRIMAEFDAADTEAKTLQEYHIQQAQEIGFTREAFKATRVNYTRMNADSENVAEYIPIMRSGYHQVHAFRDRVSQIRDNMQEQFNDIRGFAQSAYITCATAGSIATTIDLPDCVDPVILDLPLFLSPSKEYVVDRLTIIDPSLADSYRQIDQSYYATDADNIRSSLFSMRQTFDHFFHNLAPDEAVKASRFWERTKNEKGEEIVTRAERIKYAITTHIKNKIRAEMFMNDLKMIIDSYNFLNSLHTRGSVNKKAAKTALSALKHFLESFVEAMDI